MYRNPCVKVDVVNAAERSIRLSGVDLVDGTPVFDIKPYVPDYDCPRPRRDSVADSVGKNCDVHVAVRGICGKTEGLLVKVLGRGSEGIATQRK